MNESRSLRLMGMIGLILLAITWISCFHSLEVLRAYLVAYLLYLELSLGSIVMLMIFALTDGAWAHVSQAVLKASARAVHLFIPLFIPVLLNLDRLYPWANPDQLKELGKDARFHSKLHYLNSSGFTFRALIYLLSWSALSFFWMKWTREAESDSQALAKLKRLSAFGLVWYGFTVTFASIDWQMSLEPSWYSTIYGMVFGIGQGLGAWAFALLVLSLRSMRLSKAQNKPHRTPTFPMTLKVGSKKIALDLGNILLAFVMTWAYLSFVQYLIIWLGNLPEESDWFYRRTHGGWQWIALFLILFQFAAPFVSLLFRAVKNHALALATVASLVLLVRILDRIWYVDPAFADHASARSVRLLVHGAVILGFGLVWIALFLSQYRSLRSQEIMAAELAQKGVPDA